MEFDVLGNFFYITVKKPKKRKRPSTKGKTALLKLLKENNCELVDDGDGIYFLEFPEGKKYDGCYSGYYVHSNTWSERLEECKSIIGDFVDWDSDDWIEHRENENGI